MYRHWPCSVIRKLADGRKEISRRCQYYMVTTVLVISPFFVYFNWHWINFLHGRMTIGQYILFLPQYYFINFFGNIFVDISLLVIFWKP